MKRVLIACGLLLLFPTLAPAQDHGPFGLGIQVGEVAGVSAKMWLNDDAAVDGLVAWSFDDEDDEVHIQGDYLMHDFGLFEVDRGALPIYYGIGARASLRDLSDDRFGLRVPIGLSYMFDRRIADIYLEMAPVLDLVPDTDVDLSGAVGFRYYF